MSRWLTAGILALITVGLAFSMSYIALDHFYGESVTVTETQNITIENSGQSVIVDNISYSVENAELQGDSYKLTTAIGGAAAGEDNLDGNVPYSGWGYSSVPAAPSISVPQTAYEQAQETGQPVTVANTTTTETKPINVAPIAASIGVAAGIVAVAIWIGYRQQWGEATSALLEQGLHDMTVRDVEIVGYIMQKEEFTIPELMKLSSASKITVWRTVQKLVESGLVKITDQTKPSSNGLGGRGKPSQIYKYVGKKAAQSDGSGSSGETTDTSPPASTR